MTTESRERLWSTVRPFIDAGLVISLGGVFVYVVTQFAMISNVAIAVTKLEQVQETDRKAWQDAHDSQKRETDKRFEDLERDRRFYREKFLSDLVKIKTKLGIEN